VNEVELTCDESSSVWSNWSRTETWTSSAQILKFIYSKHARIRKNNISRENVINTCECYKPYRYVITFIGDGSYLSRRATVRLLCCPCVGCEYVWPAHCWLLQNKTRKPTRPNDASARLPNLTLASWDPDLWPPYLQSWPFHLLVPLITCANCQKNRFIICFVNIVLTVR